MFRVVMLAVVAVALAGCDKQPVAAPICRAPVLIQHAPLRGYAGQRERADHCVKQAAFELTRSGGPVAIVATEAMARCATQERAAVAALTKEGQGWSYRILSISPR